MPSIENRESSGAPGLLPALNRPVPTRDEEQALLARIRAGDRDARNLLVESNLRYVVRVASSFKDLGLPLEDMIHEGCLGLIEAAEKYDPARGTRFITCAHWWIRKALLAWIEKHRCSVSVSAGYWRTRRLWNASHNDLQSQLGRLPEEDEVREQSRRASPRSMRSARLPIREVSLDAPRESRPRDARDPVDSSIEDPLARLQREEMGEWVREAILALPERERTVIDWRYGLTSGTPMVLREVGDRLQLSRERVRQIENRACSRIRSFFVRRRLAPPKPPESSNGLLQCTRRSPLTTGA